MGNVDERKRKKKRTADVLAFEQTERARAKADALLTPEQRRAAFLSRLSHYDQQCEDILEARLQQKFGVKAEYDDWEVDQASDELEAQGAYPPEPELP
jgi:hypothetical protein